MPRDQEVPEAEEDLDRSLNCITTEEIGVIIKKLKPGEIAECKTKFMKRCLFIFVAYGVCWVCLCCHNPPNSDMDVLLCAQMLMHAIAQRGVQTLKESLH